MKTGTASVERLRAEIDRIANTPCPRPERERRIAELEQEIEGLQRVEEAVVVATDARRERGCRHGSCWVISPGVEMVGVVRCECSSALRTHGQVV
jgi:hypothetical protein